MIASWSKHLSTLRFTLTEDGEMVEACDVEDDEPDELCGDDCELVANLQDKLDQALLHIQEIEEAINRAASFVHIYQPYNPH